MNIQAMPQENQEHSIKPNFNTNIIHVTCLDGYPAFEEVVESVIFALKSLGYEVHFAHASIRKDAINLIFASHCTSLEHFLSSGLCAEQIIIYNLEQVSTSVPWFNQRYFELMRHVHVWEYCAENLTDLKQAGIENIHLVPIGYTQNLEKIEQRPIEQQDIDVFFYGTISARRRKCLQAIRDLGLNVVTTEHQQIVGKERDALIARSKVVLNLHYYENAHIFEIVRVSYLMANHKTVVSELGPQTCIEADIKQAITHGAIDTLPQLCKQLVEDANLRLTLQNQAFETIKQRDTIAYVKQGMQAYLNSLNQAPNSKMPVVTLPKALQIGAKRWRYDCLNLDKDARHKPDWLLDISKPLPFNESIHSWRFGEHTLEKGYFDYIVSEHTLEEVDDLWVTLTNCLALLKDGGELRCTVYHDLSHQAWQNPFMKRLFNENSFQYYVYPHSLYELGWYSHTLEVINFTVHLSDYGNELMAKYQDFETVKHMPRAIDRLNFILRKRPINETEKIVLQSKVTI